MHHSNEKICWDTFCSVADDDDDVDLEGGFPHNSTMTKDPPLLRQWLLLKALSARHFGVTIKELADELGVAQKTVRRDLKTFQTLAFPIEEETGDFGRKSYRMDSSWRQPQLGFTFEEVVALYLGRQWFEPLIGTPFGNAARSAFRKIQAALDAKALRHLEKIAGNIHFTAVGAGNYADKSDLIDCLLVGIEDRRIVHIAYQSLRATEPVTYEVYPYAITYHRGSLYLIAHSTQHGEVRHFKVDRVHSAEATVLQFNRPEDFDVRNHLAASFGIYQGDGDVVIVVRFAREVARFVAESQWHPSQELTRQRDGSLLGEFRLSTTEEIKRWILSFGHHAQVIAPESFREEMAAEARAMLGMYARPPERTPRDGAGEQRQDAAPTPARKTTRAR